MYSTCSNSYNEFNRYSSLSNPAESPLDGDFSRTSHYMSMANQNLNMVNNCMERYAQLVRSERGYCNDAIAYSNLISPRLGTFAVSIRSNCSSPVARQSPPLPVYPSPAPSQDSQSTENHDVWLYDGESQQLAGYFNEGESIYGECDRDCDDIDLKLYDSDGDLVDEDTLSDDVPTVEAPYEGWFTIKVIMHSCTHQSGCEAWISSDDGF